MNFCFVFDKHSNFAARFIDTSYIGSRFNSFSDFLYTHLCFHPNNLYLHRFRLALDGGGVRRYDWSAQNSSPSAAPNAVIVTIETISNKLTLGPQIQNKK